MSVFRKNQTLEQEIQQLQGNLAQAKEMLAREEQAYQQTQQQAQAQQNQDGTTSGLSPPAGVKPQRLLQIEAHVQGREAQLKTLQDQLKALDPSLTQAQTKWQEAVQALEQAVPGFVLKEGVSALTMIDKLALVEVFAQSDVGNQKAVLNLLSDAEGAMYFNLNADKMVDPIWTAILHGKGDDARKQSILDNIEGISAANFGLGLKGPVSKDAVSKFSEKFVAKRTENGDVSGKMALKAGVSEAKSVTDLRLFESVRAELGKGLENLSRDEQIVLDMVASNITKLMVARYAFKQTEIASGWTIRAEQVDLILNLMFRNKLNASARTGIGKSTVIMTVYVLMNSMLHDPTISLMPDMGLALEYNSEVMRKVMDVQYGDYAQKMYFIWDGDISMASLQRMREADTVIVTRDAVGSLYVVSDDPIGLKMQEFFENPRNNVFVDESDTLLTAIEYIRGDDSANQNVVGRDNAWVGYSLSVATLAGISVVYDKMKEDSKSGKKAIEVVWELSKNSKEFQDKVAQKLTGEDKSWMNEIFDSNLKTMNPEVVNLLEKGDLAGVGEDGLTGLMFWKNSEGFQAQPQFSPLFMLLVMSSIPQVSNMPETIRSEAQVIAKNADRLMKHITQQEMLAPKGEGEALIKRVEGQKVEADILARTDKMAVELLSVVQKYQAHLQTLQELVASYTTTNQEFSKNKGRTAFSVRGEPSPGLLFPLNDKQTEIAMSPLGEDGSERSDQKFNSPSQVVLFAFFHSFSSYGSKALEAKHIDQALALTGNASISPSVKKSNVASFLARWMDAGVKLNGVTGSPNLVLNDFLGLRFYDPVSAPQPRTTNDKLNINKNPAMGVYGDHWHLMETQNMTDYQKAAEAMKFRPNEKLSAEQIEARKAEYTDRISRMFYATDKVVLTQDQVKAVQDADFQSRLEFLIQKQELSHDYIDKNPAVKKFVQELMIKDLTSPESRAENSQQFSKEVSDFKKGMEETSAQVDLQVSLLRQIGIKTDSKTPESKKASDQAMFDLAYRMQGLQKTPEGRFALEKIVELLRTQTEKSPDYNFSQAQQDVVQLLNSMVGQYVGHTMTALKDARYSLVMDVTTMNTQNFRNLDKYTQEQGEMIATRDRQGEWILKLPEQKQWGKEGEPREAGDLATGGMTLYLPSSDIARSLGNFGKLQLNSKEGESWRTQMLEKNTTMPSELRTALEQADVIRVYDRSDVGKIELRTNEKGEKELMLPPLQAIYLPGGASRGVNMEAKPGYAPYNVRLLVSHDVDMARTLQAIGRDRGITFQYDGSKPRVPTKGSIKIAAPTEVFFVGNGDYRYSKSDGRLAEQSVLKDLYNADVAMTTEAKALGADGSISLERFIQMTARNQLQVDREAFVRQLVMAVNMPLILTLRKVLAELEQIDERHVTTVKKNVSNFLEQAQNPFSSSDFSGMTQQNVIEVLNEKMHQARENAGKILSSFGLTAAQVNGSIGHENSGAMSSTSLYMQLLMGRDLLTKLKREVPSQEAQHVANIREILMGFATSFGQYESLPLHGRGGGDKGVGSIVEVKSFNDFERLLESFPDLQSRLPQMTYDGSRNESVTVQSVSQSGRTYALQQIMSGKTDSFQLGSQGETGASVLQETVKGGEPAVKGTGQDVVTPSTKTDLITTPQVTVQEGVYQPVSNLSPVGAESQSGALVVDGRPVTEVEGQKLLQTVQLTESQRREIDRLALERAKRDVVDSRSFKSFVDQQYEGVSIDEDRVREDKNAFKARLVAEQFDSVLRDSKQLRAMFKIAYGYHATEELEKVAPPRATRGI